mgnify:CR=1 FL=1
MPLFKAKYSMFNPPLLYLLGVTLCAIFILTSSCNTKSRKNLVDVKCKSKFPNIKFNSRQLDAGNQMSQRLRRVNRGHSGILPTLPFGAIGGKSAGKVCYHS